MTTLEEIMQGTRDTYTVGRVFGSPIKNDGMTVIPVATVAGGGGGGQGAMTQPELEGEGGAEAEGTEGAPGEGSGGGFGGMAKPAGVYVIRGDQVAWKPAVDVNRLAMAGIILGAIIAVVVGIILSHD